LTESSPSLDGIDFATSAVGQVGEGFFALGLDEMEKLTRGRQLVAPDEALGHG
jgi:hypothetical protein